MMGKPAAAIPLSGTAQEDFVPAARPKRKKFRQENLIGYLFVSPWLIGFLLFALIPMAISLGLSFTDYDILGSAHFNGFQNFQHMFTADPRYLRSLNATFLFVAVSVPLRLAFALGVAMLMNAKHHGVYWYRAIYYIPSIIGSSVAVAVMWRQLFGNDGLINGILATVGVANISWLGNPQTAIWTLILLAIWQFGSPMLVFLAGLRNIPREL